MNGLHIFGDLYDCRCTVSVLHNTEPLRGRCVELCIEVGLTVVCDAFHQFGKGGTTGTIVLAESHLAIHTWPEIKSATLDVYVCNFSGDNRARASALFDGVLKILQPAQVDRQMVIRGERLF